MKTKMKLLILSMSFILLVLLVGSCSTPVEKADNLFKTQIDTVIGNELAFIASTIEFVYYANPVNYWYPEEYTFQDILDDRFRTGFRGLKRLQEEINRIPIYDFSIKEAIDSLDLQIVVTLDNIKEKQNAMDDTNGLFGMLAYGGTSGLMDIFKLFMTEDEKREMNENGRTVPNNIANALRNLVIELYVNYYRTAEKMNILENKAFEFVKPNVVEKNEIRHNLKLFVRNRINQQFNSRDTICRDEMIKELFDIYDKEYPLY